MSANDDSLATGLLVAVMGTVPAILFGGILLGSTAGTFRPVAAAGGLVVAAVVVFFKRDQLDIITRSEATRERSRRERIKRTGLFLGPYLLFLAGSQLAPAALVDSLTSAFVGGSVSLALAGILLIGQWGLNTQQSDRFRPN